MEEWEYRQMKKKETNGKEVNYVEERGCSIEAE
jgi:hypothetical protein